MQTHSDFPQQDSYGDNSGTYLSMDRNVKADTIELQQAPVVLIQRVLIIEGCSKKKQCWWKMYLRNMRRWITHVRNSYCTYPYQVLWRNKRTLFLFLPGGGDHKTLWLSQDSAWLHHPSSLLPGVPKTNWIKTIATTSNSAKQSWKGKTSIAIKECSHYFLMFFGCITCLVR